MDHHDTTLLLLEELKKARQDDHKIVEEMALGAEPRDWESSDWAQFRAATVFRAMGLVASMCLIFIPMNHTGDAVDKYGQLLVGSGLGLLPSVVLGQSGAGAQQERRRGNGKRTAKSGGAK